MLQEEELNDKTAGICGRKMDLHVKWEDLELNNSEFKAVAKSKQQGLWQAVIQTK